jgi:hypothetical protein
VNKQQNNSDKNDDEPKVEMISSSSPYPSWVSQVQLKWKRMTKTKKKKPN